MGIDRRKEDKLIGKILLLENDTQFKRLISEIIQDVGDIYVEVVEDVSDILVSCKDNLWDLIIVDLRLPEPNGSEFIIKVKEFQPYSNIIINSCKELEISKEIKYRDLGIDEIYCKSKEIGLLKIMIKNILNKRKVMYRDSMTQALSKMLLEPALNNEIQKLKNEGHNVSVINIDYNKFKQINDNLGHYTGDRVLIETSKLILNNIRTSDLFFRAGGDEFFIIMSDVQLEEAKVVMKRICSLIKNNEDIKKLTGGDFSISVGIVEGELGDNEKSLKIKSDLAMYSAKRKHKDIGFRSKGNGEYETDGEDT